MSTSASAQIGWQLQRGDGGSPTELFTAVAEVVDIDRVGYASDVLDVTDQTSPQGVREKIAGLADGGEVTVKLHWLANNLTHQALKTDQLARTLRNFRVVGVGRTYAFRAVIQAFSFIDGGALGEKLEGSLTLAVSGVYTES